MRRLALERPAADEALVAEIEQRAGRDAMRRELATALAAHSEPVRRAVELRVVDELPCADLAARLRISEQAARARVSRGLAAPADVLDAQTIREATTS